MYLMNRSKFFIKIHLQKNILRQHTNSSVMEAGIGCNKIMKVNNNYAVS